MLLDKLIVLYYNALLCNMKNKINKKLIYAILASGITISSAVAFNAYASIDLRTASEFSKFCAKNKQICFKADFENARTATVICPSECKQITEVYVHAGDGQTIYKLPHEGFSYSINGNSVTVTLSGHKHDISWIGILCTGSPEPTPSPSPSPFPSPTPISSPSPTPTPTPSPSPSPIPSPDPTPSPSPNVGSNTNTNTSTNTSTNTNTNENKIENKNENKVEIKIENNTTETTNVTQGTVAGVTSAVNVPTKQPETGVGNLGLISMFGAAPLGFILSKYGKGSVFAKDNNSQLTKAVLSAIEERNSKLA